jgi:DNA-binding GntR family transcriptional regulator
VVTHRRFPGWEQRASRKITEAAVEIVLGSQYDFKQRVFDFLSMSLLMALRTKAAPATFPTAGKGLLKEHAYTELKRRILQGEFTPGAFLSERQLALDLEMSKTPIRAAVERLEAEGFLAISPQQGLVVRELAIHELADHLEVRYALEPYVLRQIAGRLTPAQVEQLEANLAGQQETVAQQDQNRMVELDSAFHILLCTFHGNGEFLRVMEQLRAKIHRVVHRVNGQHPERMRTAYEEHLAIADAVLAGDGELAAKHMIHHLEVGKTYLLSPRRRP